MNGDSTIIYDGVVIHVDCHYCVQYKYSIVTISRNVERMDIENDNSNNSSFRNDGVARQQSLYHIIWYTTIYSKIIASLFFSFYVRKRCLFDCCTFLLACLHLASRRITVCLLLLLLGCVCSCCVRLASQRVWHGIGVLTTCTWSRHFSVQKLPCLMGHHKTSKLFISIFATYYRMQTLHPPAWRQQFPIISSARKFLDYEPIPPLSIGSFGTAIGGRL
jgi:hypothetical protein